MNCAKGSINNCHSSWAQMSTLHFMEERNLNTYAKNNMKSEVSIFTHFCWTSNRSVSKENSACMEFNTFLLGYISGRLFGVAGEQPFIGSSLSSAFPLVNHPAFGALYSAGAGRPEFGGLGSLGVSAALATHPQLGALSGKTGGNLSFGQQLAKWEWAIISFLSSPVLSSPSQSGGELLKPITGELLPFSPPSSASLHSSPLTSSPTTASVLVRSGCPARIATPHLKVTNHPDNLFLDTLLHYILLIELKSNTDQK